MLGVVCSLDLTVLHYPLPVTTYPWQGCRRAGAKGGFITTNRELTHGDKQLFMLTFTPIFNFESPVNLTCMFSD